MLKQWINLLGLFGLAVLPTASYAQPVIPAKYEWTKTTPWQGRDFSEGLVGICYESGEATCGYMNKVGQLVIMTDFSSIGDFHEGMALVTHRVNKFSVEARRRQTYGFIDKSGKTVIPLKFNNVGNFSEGLAAAYIKGKWGYIDKKGIFVIPPKFSKANEFRDGVAVVETGNENSAIIDRRGKLVKVFNANNLQFPSDKFSEGLLSVLHSEKGFGYFNTKGKQVIPYQFTEAGDFSEGLAVAIKKAMLNDDNSDNIFSGYINKLGKSVIDLNVKNSRHNVKLHPRNFKEGLALIITRSIVNDNLEVESCKYINRINQAIISIDNISQCEDFEDGLAKIYPIIRSYVPNRMSSYFIDKQGLKVLSLSSNKLFLLPNSGVFNFKEGLGKIIFRDGENNAYVDKQGRVVFQSPKRSP